MTTGYEATCGICGKKETLSDEVIDSGRWLPECWDGQNELGPVCASHENVRLGADGMYELVHNA